MRVNFHMTADEVLMAIMEWFDAQEAKYDSTDFNQSDISVQFDEQGLTGATITIKRE